MKQLESTIMILSLSKIIGRRNEKLQRLRNRLLLFQVESKTDLGMKRHSCAFVSVMEEYTGPRRPGERLKRTKLHFKSPTAERRHV